MVGLVGMTERSKSPADNKGMKRFWNSCHASGDRSGAFRVSDETSLDVASSSYSKVFFFFAIA